MAILHYDAAGQVVTVLDTPELESRVPNPPAGGGSLVFDQDTNPAILADAKAVTGRYTFSGGQLRKDGSPVTVAGDAPDNVRAARVALDAFIANGSPSNAQVIAQVRLHARILKKLLRAVQ